MSSIQLPGLLTGIDTQQLIAQLMAVERRSLTLYENRRDTWDERKTALSDLESKLSTLRSTVQALSDSDELRAFNVSSSDEDIITAEATYNAFEGNHTVKINQLATAERWVHTNGLEFPEDYVGAGTFIYSYNHKESVITTTATTTLEEFAGLINNDANNPGVTASLLYYNDNYHLVLNGNDAGTDYEISINASNTEVHESESEFEVDSDNATLNSKITELDQFSGTLGDGDGATITIIGKDHNNNDVSDTLNVTSNTKISHLISKINDAFGDTATAIFENGKIILTDHTCATSSMQLSLSYDPGTGSTSLTIPAISRITEGGSITANLTNFAAGDFTESQSAQDSEIKVDGFPPGAEDWITRSSNTIDDVIYGVTLHLHDITDATGEEINLTRDVESVKEKLNDFIEAYNATIQFVKEKTGYNDILKTAGILMGDYVVRNISEQLRTPLIAQTNGFIIDIDTFLMPGQIGLELDRDGVLSLDSTAFDEAIAEDYLGVLAIIGADKTGSSTSNTVEFYGASSKYTTAGQYDVEVVVGGGVITSAKIKLSTESTYRDMTVDGNVVTGNSTFDDDGYPLYAENGLQLSVDLSQNNTFTATVRVKQGFTGAIEDALDNMLKATTGSIQIDQEHVNDQIELLQDKIDAEERRLEIREERLIGRFARLEKMLALLQSQFAYLGLV